MIEKHLKDLGKELEIDSDFSTEVPGVYIFPIEDDVVVTLTEQAPGYKMTSTLCACPKMNLETFYSQMMLANLFGQGTKGAVLGLNSEGNMLTLSKTIEYNPDYKIFKETLEDFINVVDFWREEAVNHK